MKAMAETSLSKLKNAVASTYALARALPGFFRERVSLDQAEEELKRAIERRAESFLEIARTRIYGDSASSYLRLLNLAGCEYADLRSQVLADGLEATLERLARAGVYLTADEFKGKVEVVRSGRSFPIAPKSFEGARPAAGFQIESSGTTRRPERAMLALERQTVYSYPTAAFFSAHGLFGASHAIYDAILPGGGGVNNLLIQAKLGMNTDRWFARTIPTESRLGGAYYYLTTYLVVAFGKRYGPGFPRPEFVDGRNVMSIVEWIAGELERGKICCVKTTPSNAMRIAQTALAAGVSLRGTKFIVSGEPFTEAKQAVIVDAGASATSRYSYTEGGIVGLGCANPIAHDEIHVFRHFLTLVERPEPLGRGSAIRPLLFTTLHPLATRLLLNVENGDYGVVDDRDCGCALQRAGLTLHLSGIRSYEKFTGEGMNYFYGDLYGLVEKTLPSEFGGGPGDYQLAEEEDESGQTRLTLRIDPRVGDVDEAVLITRLRQALGSGSWQKEFQARVWDRAGTLRIKREPPVASARGKIVPLQLHTRARSKTDR
jgi:hypothetical protein